MPESIFTRVPDYLSLWTTMKMSGDLNEMALKSAQMQKDVVQIAGGCTNYGEILSVSHSLPLSTSCPQV